MFSQIVSSLKSAWKLLPKSYNLIKENLGIFALLNSVPLLLTVLSALNGDPEVGSNTAGNYNINWGAGLGVGAGLAAVFLVLSVLLQIMMLRLTLDVAKGQKTSLSRLWDFAKEYFFRLVGMAMVSALAVIAIVFVVMGIPSLIFNIFGIPLVGVTIGVIALLAVLIVLTARYFFAPYIMVDQDLGIMDSFNASKKMSQSRELLVLSVVVVSIVLSVLPSLLGRVGSIIAALLGIAYSVAPALRYLEFKKLK